MDMVFNIITKIHKTIFDLAYFKIMKHFTNLFQKTKESGSQGKVKQTNSPFYFIFFGIQFHKRNEKIM